MSESPIRVRNTAPNVSPIRSFVAGVVAFCIPNQTPELLIELDFNHELSRNAGLRDASPERLASFRQELRVTTRHRAVLVRRKTAKSLVLMLTAVATGWIAHMLFRRQATAHVGGIAVLSALAFAWGTLGRLGWEGQSIAGDTSIERIDAGLLRLLYWLGMALATVALL